MSHVKESCDLYFKQGSSDKEYHASIESMGTDFVVRFSYGRRGSTLTYGTKTDSPVCHEEAQKIYDKLVKEKLGKGYRPSISVTPRGGITPASVPASIPVTVEKVETGVFPQLLNPIEEKDVEKYIKNDNWVAQEKHDGKRMMIHRPKKDGNPFASNRKGQVIAYPEEIAGALYPIKETYLLDGEAVGDTLWAFDILEYNGEDLREKPYFERYEALENFIKRTGTHIKLVKMALTQEDKKAMLEGLKKDRKEGIVFKNGTSSYSAGRPASGGNQIKFKFYATCTAMVTDISAGKRSVELGVLNADGGKTMQAVGKCTIPPNFDVPPKGTLVEIRYLYAYKAGALYQPVYLGARDDKDVPDTHDSLKFKADEADEDEA